MPHARLSTTLALLAALGGGPTLAHAENMDKGCATLGQTAGVVMTARQVGTDLSQVLALVDKDITHPVMRKLLRALVMDAYGQPRYSGTESQQRAIDDFRNATVLECLKHFPED